MPFSRIIGQAKAVRLLQQALRSGRLPHSYLFLGPEGVGKATLARALAALLLCRSAAGRGPACGLCPDCKKMAAGSHPDWIQIHPEGASIKIQQIRELKKATNFPPLTASQRIILMDDAHTLGREAGNSLLKLLEEPPPNNLFLLVASDTEALLATLMSRCQIIPCTPLSQEQCIQVLQQSHPHLSLAEIQTMSTLAQGCPGQSSSFANTEVLQLYQECRAAFVACSSQKAVAVEQALSASGRLAEFKEESSLVLDLFAFFLQDCLRGQEPQDEYLRKTRERWNFSQLSAMVEALEQARSDLNRNCNRALVCDVLFLKLFCDLSP